MFSTWETFAKKRYEKGREDERKVQAKRIVELEKRNAELKKQIQDLTDNNRTKVIEER